MLDLYRRAVAENPGKRIVLMGDSSGGGLAAVISLSLAEAGDTQPDELALISPWVDITNTTRISPTTSTPTRSWFPSLSPRSVAPGRAIPH